MKIIYVDVDLLSFYCLPTPSQVLLSPNTELTVIAACHKEEDG